MQMKVVDFSKLPVLLKATTDELKHMKEENSDWVSLVNEKIISVLEQEHGIVMSHAFGSSRSSIQTITDYRTRILFLTLTSYLKTSSSNSLTRHSKLWLPCQSLTLLSCPLLKILNCHHVFKLW